MEKEKIEKEQWQAEREQLEDNVEELRAERDEARRDLNAQGEQWGIIVRNAGRIEHGLWDEVKRLRKSQSRVGTGLGDSVATNRCGNSCAGQEKLRRRVEMLEEALERYRQSGMEVQNLAAKLAGVGTDMVAAATGAPVPPRGPGHSQSIGLGVGVS